MANKRNSRISTRHERDVLSKILGPTECAKTKNCNYSPIQQGCMNTRSGREKFRNLRILLNSGRSSAIVMGNMTSKLKKKETTMTTWET